MDFGSGTERTYNIVSLVFVGLSVFACIIFTVMLLAGGSTPTETIEVPTEFMLPSLTPSNTPTITRTPLPATFTPTFTFTPTSTRTPSPTPTIEASATITATPTITETSQPSETPTETPTVTATFGTPPTSPPPWIFGNDPLQFIQNTNSAGCAWQGVAGQVLDLNRQAYQTQLIVEVSGGGLPTPLTANTGSNTLYGASGFEIQIANGINTQTYFVQLKSRAGSPISDLVQVSFPGDCAQNAGLITFVQIREP